MTYEEYGEFLKNWKSAFVSKVMGDNFGSNAGYRGTSSWLWNEPMYNAVVRLLNNPPSKKEAEAGEGWGTYEALKNFAKTGDKDGFVKALNNYSGRGMEYTPEELEKIEMIKLPEKKPEEPKEPQTRRTDTEMYNDEVRRRIKESGYVRPLRPGERLVPGVQGGKPVYLPWEPETKLEPKPEPTLPIEEALKVLQKASYVPSYVPNLSYPGPIGPRVPMLSSRRY